VEGKAIMNVAKLYGKVILAIWSIIIGVLVIISATAWFIFWIGSIIEHRGMAIGGLVFILIISMLIAFIVTLVIATSKEGPGFD
jgi:hypothetical protein